MILKGDNIILYISVEGTWTPYVCGRVVTVNYTTDSIETSVSGSGLWATFLPTKNSFTISLEGIVDINESAVLTLADLRALQFSQTIFMVKIVRTDDLGASYTEQGSAFITSSSDTGSFDGVNTFSVEMIGTGEVTQQSLIPPPGRILREDGTTFIQRETGTSILIRE